MSIEGSIQVAATPEQRSMTLPTAEPCTDVQYRSSPPPPSSATVVSGSPPWRCRLLISWRTPAVRLIHIFYCLLTIKIHVFCYLSLRHRADRARPAPTNGDLVNDITDAAILTSRTWRTNVRVVTRFWKLSRIASAIFLPASVALLQIPPVFNNLTSRTFAILASISALTGLISGFIYLNLRGKIASPQTAERWVEASVGEMCHTVRSIEFWAALAFPISSTVWCLMWFMLSMFVLAWDHSGEDEPHYSVVGLVMSGLSASSLAIVAGVQLWRAVNALIVLEGG